MDAHAGDPAESAAQLGSEPGDARLKPSRRDGERALDRRAQAEAGCDRGLAGLEAARIEARRPGPAVPGRAELVRHAWRRLLKGNLRDA